MRTFFQPTANKKNRTKKKEQGFILVDTIVAIAIISIAFVSVFSTIQVIATSAAKTSQAITESCDSLFESRTQLYAQIRDSK